MLSLSSEVQSCGRLSLLKLTISSCDAVSNSWLLALTIHLLSVQAAMPSVLAISVNVLFSFRLSAFSTSCILNDVVNFLFILIASG